MVPRSSFIAIWRNTIKFAQTAGSISNYSTGKIQREMSRFGETPRGPITSETKRAYLLRLKKLRLGLVVPNLKFDQEYCQPLADSLKNVASITRNWENLWKLETEMAEPGLAQGMCKSSFNYQQETVLILHRFCTYKIWLNLF